MHGPSQACVTPSWAVGWHLLTTPVSQLVPSTRDTAPTCTFLHTGALPLMPSVAPSPLPPANLLRGLAGGLVGES